MRKLRLALDEPTSAKKQENIDLKERWSFI